MNRLLLAFALACLFLPSVALSQPVSQSAIGKQSEGSLGTVLDVSFVQVESKERQRIGKRMGRDIGRYTNRSHGNRQTANIIRDLGEAFGQHAMRHEQGTRLIIMDRQMNKPFSIVFPGKHAFLVGEAVLVMGKGRNLQIIPLR